MDLSYILAAVVLMSVGVIAYIVMLLKKEMPGKNEVKIEPVISPQSLKLPESIRSTADAEYKRKIEELEEELKQLTEKHLVKDAEFIAQMEALTKENQVLKEAQAKQDEMRTKQSELVQEQLQQVNAENISLRSQLNEALEKTVLLEQQVSQSRGQIEADLIQARTMIEQLKSERESFVNNRELALQSAQAIAREFEEIKAVNEGLMTKEEEARFDAAKAKELLEELTRKNQAIQMELSKYRAQASGLEKICENYKLQLAERAHA